MVVRKLAPEEAYEKLFAQAKPHLGWAKNESDARAAVRLGELSEFFESAKTGVPTFADDANGWYAKYYFLRQKTSFVAKGKYFDEYLSASFARNVFTAESLEAEVKAAVEGYLADLQSVEAEMLVRMRADIATLDLKGFEPLSEQEIESRYRTSLAETLAQSSNLNMRTTLEGVGTTVAADIATVVLTQVLVKMGVFGTTTAAGAAGAPFTFGLSVAAGLVVGLFIDYVWSWFSDPEGALTDKVCATIDTVNAHVRGDDTAGMQEAFAKLAAERVEIRQSAIEKFCREASQR